MLIEKHPIGCEYASLLQSVYFLMIFVKSTNTDVGEIFN